MKKILNIVNSDAMIKKLTTCNIPGLFLAWQDFLHEGPVPKHHSLESLSSIRAHYIAQKGMGSIESIHQNFKTRNATLHAYRKYEKVILWFEHDLYDQLQLIQILDWFGKYASSSHGIYLIQSSTPLLYQDRTKLQARLIYHREAVTHAHLITARKAWSAFCASTPEAWFKLLHDDTSALPFLKGILIRMLEEYPNTINGLSRTAHQALLIIDDGVHHPNKIYARFQSTEVRPFMGDVLFWDILQQLINRDALRRYDRDRQLGITPLGKALLQGQDDWLALNEVDFWLGGVHQQANRIWRWDIAQQRPILIHH